MPTFDSNDGASCEAGVASPEGTDEDGPELPKVCTSESGRSYQRGERVGSGGYGAVFRAVEEGTKCEFAVKIALKAGGKLRDLGAYQRLKPRPPGVVEILDNGTIDGRDFIVMEFIHGPTLDQWVEARRSAPDTPVGAYEWLPFFDSILDTISIAHEKGIAHLDLKPPNILLRCDAAGMTPLLTDFGVALLLPTQSSSGSTGIIAGSPTYWSPEQSRRERGDRRSDVFSLAGIFLELFTGRGTPWADCVGVHTHLVTRGAIASEPVSALLDVAVGRDSYLFDVLRKALAAAPEDRYSDAGEFRRALRLSDARKVFDFVQRGGTSLDLAAIDELRRLAAELSPLCQGAIKALDDHAIEARERVDREARARADAELKARGRAIPSAPPPPIVEGQGRGRMVALVLAALLSFSGIGYLMARPGGSVDKGTREGEALSSLVGVPPAATQRVILGRPEDYYGMPSHSPEATSQSSTASGESPAAVVSRSGAAAMGSPPSRGGAIESSNFGDIKYAIRSKCPRVSKAIRATVEIRFDANGTAIVGAVPGFEADPAGRCALQILRRWRWATGQPHTQVYWLRIEPNGGVSGG